MTVRAPRRPDFPAVVNGMAWLSRRIHEPRVSMFSLLFTRRYSMAHRLLSDRSSKCAIPHGHNEIVTARIVAVAPLRLDGRANMVAPFEDAKRRWHAWIDEAVDHALQVSEDDPLIGYFRAMEPDMLARLVVMPGDPTTELLAACFMAKLNAFLADDGGRLRCAEVTIEETPTNTVVFAGDPADALPERTGRNRTPWWRRPDMSINDLAG
jgi:6-pyruvoyltetrahydropterin/6-carboxytetrahydropterin synthase